MKNQANLWKLGAQYISEYSEFNLTSHSAVRNTNIFKDFPYLIYRDHRSNRLDNLSYSLIFKLNCLIFSPPQEGAYQSLI